MFATKVRMLLALSTIVAATGGSLHVSAQESIAQGFPSSEDERRLITVADAIGMTKLADYLYSADGPSFGRVAQLSPDGKTFVVVLRRGSLEQNTTVYSLLLCESETVFTSGVPEVVLTMSSSSNREGIANIRWFDNETLTFIGENPDEQPQLYAFNLRSRELKKLTNSPTGVISYSLGATLDRIAFVGQALAKSLWDEKTRRDGVVVFQQTIPDLIAGRARSESDLYVQTPGASRRMNIYGSLGLGMPFLSPDGKYIVVAVRVPTLEIPERWKRYQDRSLELQTRTSTQRIAPVTSFLAQYELVDTSTGESRVLLDSPIWPPYTGGWPPETGVIWLPDSQSVVLSNVLLPFENVGEIEQKARQQHKYTIEVNVSNGELTKIGDGQLQARRWDVTTSRLVCETQPDWRPGTADELREKPRPILTLTKSPSGWRPSGLVQEEPNPEIILREGMNDPPKIYARQPTTHQERLLLDLNPQFQGLRFGKVEEIQWVWSKGHLIKAGLYYPAHYVPGNRYPLVIQTHNWTPHRFWIDGPWTTAYAAQPLAAKGMMVLQVQDEYIPLHYGKTGQKEEVDKALAIYASAVDYLDRRKIIDRNRVGIIGFSHTCFYVKYALVHSIVKFAAASVTDGEDGGYLQFMTNENKFVDAYSLYGGLPFGGALKTWIRLSPGFNIEKTHTPLRITTLTPSSLMVDWEWFEAFTLLGKPVEMVIMQDGTHVLQKPSERMVSQQGNVDWFDFWLNGHEDPDPAKFQQYRRWRQMRDLASKDVRKHPEAASARTSSGE
jgi:dipeptidyl aminopeptidase/acylaminoacyl peptidase